MASLHCVSFLFVFGFCVLFVNAQLNFKDFFPDCTDLDQPCNIDDDCCSKNCATVPTDLEYPDALQLLCQKRTHSCSESGSICNSGNQCCSGICNPIALSRRGSCSDYPCLKVNNECTSGKECCSNFCNSDTGLCDTVEFSIIPGLRY